MTVSSSYSPVTYTGDGSQAAFPAPFRILAASDVRAGIVGDAGVIPLTYGTEYSVTVDADGQGGTVHYPCPAGTRLLLWLEVPERQELELSATGPLPPKELEKAFDRLTLLCQQLREQVDRAVKVDMSSDTPPDQLMDDIGAAVGVALAAASAAQGSEDAAGNHAGNSASSATQADTARAGAEAARDAAVAGVDAVASVIADAQAEILASAAFVPIGGILDFPVNTVPAGFLICAGQTVTRAAYPELVAYLTGDPMALAAVVPDYRGTVSRAADLGRGLAPDVVVGGYLDDAFQGHTHNGDYKRGWNSGGTPNYAPYYSNTLTHTAIYLPDVVVTDGVNGAPRTASETRGKSYGVVRCIKAYHAPMSAAPVDLTDVLNHLDTVASSMLLVSGTGRGLRISTTGTNAMVSVVEEEVIVSGGAMPSKRLSGVSLTLDITTVGPNGLDGGTRAASTWYSVWVIAKEDGTVAGLLSLSATSPTLPTGYMYKARRGWIRTDATANKYPLGMIQRGRVAQYKTVAGGNLTALPSMAGGSTGGVLAAVSTSAFIPPTSV
ncbi:MAG TPA: tail fiber protein, partial [Nitratidesulfovibrio sp.]|nr:tail fiber protein [Nitratidesulfovibrio sp.]